MAAAYDRFRAGYPSALIDRACLLAGLEPGDTVVEIGSGTGKLTRELVDRGLVVDAVEPDADLIAFARNALPASSVRFHDGTFEAAQLARAAFPAVFAATSFHWVDPAVGWSKVAEVLEPGGVFALLSHLGGMRDDLDEELTRVWHEVEPESQNRWTPVDDETLWAGVDSRTGNVSELWAWLSRHEHLAVPEAAQLFHQVELTREPMERALPVEDYLAVIRTTNYFLHLDPARQEQLEAGLAAVLRRHGGVYVSRGYATLVTARRA